MTDRPTPEEIAAKHLSLHRRGNPSMSGPLPQDQRRAESLIAHLRHEGYIIVHPDDVPTHRDAYPQSNHPNQAEIGRSVGWDDCRRHIFGGDQ